MGFPWTHFCANDSIIFRKSSSSWSFWVIPLIGTTSRLLCGSLITLNVNNCITKIDWLRHHWRQVRAARDGRSCAPTCTRATRAPWHQEDSRMCFCSCRELTSRRSAACLFFLMDISCSRVDGALHAMVPDVNLVCMTVFPRATPTWSNAKHADKGKGSDLEMAKRSKARNKDEVAEEKRLLGYIDKGRWEKAMSFAWYSWCSADVARCLIWAKAL